MATNTNVKLNEELNGHLLVKPEEEAAPIPFPNVPLPESVLAELRRTHPLAHLIGKYKDEPLWEELMEIVAENRRKNAELEDVD